MQRSNSPGCLYLLSKPAFWDVGQERKLVEKVDAHKAGVLTSQVSQERSQVLLAPAS